MKNSRRWNAFAWLGLVLVLVAVVCLLLHKVYSASSEVLYVRPVKAGATRSVLESVGRVLTARYKAAGATAASYEVASSGVVGVHVRGLAKTRVTLLADQVGRFEIKPLPPGYRAQMEIDSRGRRQVICQNSKGNTVPWAKSLAGVEPVVTNTSILSATPQPPDSTPISLRAIRLFESILSARPHPPHPHNEDAWVDVTLTPAATQTFSDFTQRHIGRYVVMQLDGEGLSCPVIRTRITGGRFVILSPARLDRQALAAVITNEPLPCKIIRVTPGARGS